jgi:hypothetical protein
MEAARVTLFSLLFASLFIGTHIVAGLYAPPKAPADECGKPASPPGSRASLGLELRG